MNFKINVLWKPRQIIPENVIVSTSKLIENAFEETECFGQSGKLREVTPLPPS